MQILIWIYGRRTENPLPLPLFIRGRAKFYGVGSFSIQKGQQRAFRADLVGLGRFRLDEVPTSRLGKGGKGARLYFRTRKRYM